MLWAPLFQCNYSCALITCRVCLLCSRHQLYKGRSRPICSPLIPQPGHLVVWRTGCHRHTSLPSQLQGSQGGHVACCQVDAHTVFSGRTEAGPDWPPLHPQQATQQVAQTAGQKAEVTKAQAQHDHAGCRTLAKPSKPHVPVGAIVEHEHRAAGRLNVVMRLQHSEPLTVCFH